MGHLHSDAGDVEGVGLGLRGEGQAALAGAPAAGRLSCLGCRVRVSGFGVGFRLRLDGHLEGKDLGFRV